MRGLFRPLVRLQLIVERLELLALLVVALLIHLDKSSCIRGRLLAGLEKIKLFLLRCRHVHLWRKPIVQVLTLVVTHLLRHTHTCAYGSQIGVGSFALALGLTLRGKFIKVDGSWLGWTTAGYEVLLISNFTSYHAVSLVSVELSI